MVSLEYFVALVFSTSCSFIGGDKQFSPDRIFLPSMIEYIVADSDTSITTIDYDLKNRPKVAVWENIDKNESALIRMTYDESGNILEFRCDKSDSTVLTIACQNNKNGLPILAEFKKGEEPAGTVSHKYNSDGELASLLCKNFTGWFNGEIIFSRENGRIIGAELSNGTEIVGNIVYEYDTQGNMTSEIWQIGENDAMKMNYVYDQTSADTENCYTSANTFITNNDNWYVVDEDYTWNGEEGGPSLYNYDDEGKLETKEFIRSDGLKTYTYFLYDSQRRLTKSYRMYIDGRRGTFTYKYDENRRLIDRVLWITDGKTGREMYEYNANGHMTAGKWENFDTWLSGNLKLEYDGGKIAKGFFEGPNYTVDIKFGYDEQDHIGTIRWDFSFEQYQEYTFKYKKFE